MSLIIRSLQNERVKNVVRLRERRQRQRQQRILIDGVREIGRAIGAGVRVDELYVCQALCDSDEVRRVIAEVKQVEHQLIEVTREVFEKIAFGSRHEGILLVAHPPERELATLKLPDSPLIGVLEAVEKPGNVGAIARSAEGAGLAALIVTDPGTDLFNPNAIRASLGTMFTLPVCTATAEETLAWLTARETKIFAARVDGAISYTDADYRGTAAIVLGGEAEGLSPIWQTDAVQAVKLPMLGVADSLNVSAAGAVLFYEALRQRSV